MMILIFHGYLKDKFPQGRLEVEATSAAEAISALQIYPGFRPEDGELHNVILPDFQSKDSIFAKTEKTEVHVLPIMEGSGGNGGFFQILLGAVLIATGWGIGAGATLLGVSSSTLILSGALMILGGIVQMLMPQPSLSTETSQPRSNYLPANKNTINIGTPIPLLIGRRRVYGQYLSFQVDAVRTATVTVPPPASNPFSELNPDWVASGATADTQYGGSNSDGA